MTKLVDLTGQKFGRLTVVKRTENKGEKPCWLCKCECGNEKVVRGSDLKSGNTVSCGCLRSEKNSEKMKQLNEEKWQDENFRKMKSEKMSKMAKEKWQDENFRKMKSEKSSETMKKQWQDEDFKKMRSEIMKELWQDEEMKWKMSYKGGITPITNYLRTLDVVIKWRNNCQYEANYMCELSGKKGVLLNVHHLVAFSTIVIEAHNLHNIQIKPQVKDYTQEELKLLEEYVGSWHKDNSNGIVLSEDVHKLFHSLYGKGENTPEQYIEFKERYLAGEFKEILK